MCLLFVVEPPHLFSTHRKNEDRSMAVQGGNNAAKRRQAGAVINEALRPRGVK
jgi:hypothetical protein